MMKRQYNISESLEQAQDTVYFRILMMPDTVSDGIIRLLSVIFLEYVIQVAFFFGCRISGQERETETIPKFLCMLRNNDLTREPLSAACLQHGRTTDRSSGDRFLKSGRVAGRDRVLYNGSQLVVNRTV